MDWTYLESAVGKRRADVETVKAVGQEKQGNDLFKKSDDNIQCIRNAIKVYYLARSLRKKGKGTFMVEGFGEIEERSESSYM